MNRFAPLSDDELEAWSAVAVEDIDLAPGLPPPNAPSIDKAGIDMLGSGTLVTKYKTATGQLAFGVARREPLNGKKIIRPISWVDGRGWTRRGWSKDRPLLNLPNLTESLNKPVLIVEGEKCARAAHFPFSDFVVTTSSGGAGAVLQTDWSALAGRDVLIWPDNDEPGAKYAEAVAGLLTSQGCRVAKVNLPSLFKLRTEIVGPGEPPPGWDVVDALREWPDATSLHRDMMACRVSLGHEPIAPHFISWGDFKMDERGLFEEKGSSEDGDELKRDFIAAPFEVLGMTRDPKSSSWGKILRWRDVDQREHTRVIPDADLHGEPAALCRDLAGDGLRIAPAKQAKFRNYLSGIHTKDRATIVARTGWAEINGAWSFILPGDGSIIPEGADPIILDGAVGAAYGTAGRLEDWQASVGALTTNQPIPILAISAALAGPLLQLANVGGGGITLTGQSSKGKTTVLQAAASVWGKGSESGGFVRSWRATANGLEGAAAGSSDTALVLDEIGTIRSDEMAAALYALGNGAGKARATRDGGLREPKSWRVMMISSGELGTATKLEEGRQKAKAGQTVRLLDIPADRGLGFGVFDHCASCNSSAELSQALKLASSTTFGTAGPAFVHKIIQHGYAEVSTSVAELLKDFIGDAPSGADGQTIRAAQTFGLIASAGELAVEWGIVPWSANSPTQAAMWALKAWIEARGGAGPAEDAQAIEAVRAFLMAHGEARFENLNDPPDRPIPNRAGWRAGDGASRVWYIAPAIWKAEVCAGLEPKQVARSLKAAGYLQHNRNELQLTYRIKSVHHRFYAVKAGIMGDIDHG